MTKRSRGDMKDGTPDMFGDLFDDVSGDQDDAQGESRADAGSTALNDVDSLVALLDRWVERGWLRALDRALVVFLHREVSDASPLLLLAAALASHQLGRGHVCLDLAQTLAAPDLALSLPPEGDDLSDPPPLPSDVLARLDLATWQAALDHPTLVADGNTPQPGNTPLVKVEHDATTRLYLRRYWQYEQNIRQQIAQRLDADTGATDDFRRSGFSRDGVDRRPDNAATQPSGNGTDGSLDPRRSGFSRDGADRRPDNAAAQPSGSGTEGTLDPRRSGFSRDGADRRPDKAAAQPSGNAPEGTLDPRRSGFSRDGADRRPDGATDTTALATALDALFPTSDTLDWQKIACALAARAHFAVITGGPGTGKTTTVVKLLALLQALQLGREGSRPLRIRLAAPTGKAAARLNESIAGQVENLELGQLVQLWERNSLRDEGIDQLRQAIPTEVTTLHRLLGSRPDTRHFRHHAGNPLPLDVLVIDEASMVDIEMMAAVLGALPPRARFILLGDKDQLASVEAGAVLGDLCQRAEGAHYTPATCAWLQQATGSDIPKQYQDADGQPLDQAIAMLRVSHRFDASSGIGQLAQAVNRPLGNDHSPKDKKAAVRDVFQKDYADITRLSLADADDPAFERLVIDGNPAGFQNKGVGRQHRGNELAPPTGYRHYLEVLKNKRPEAGTSLEDNRKAYEDWALAVLEAHNRFQLLCALRKGPWGVEGLNLRIAKVLKREKLIAASDVELERGWYLGRPVLVTRNDYGLGLMNGDIGITLAQPHPQDPSKSVLRVAFPTANADKPIKWVLPSRLQAVETVFAMTVHKSQGSEFTHTALLLPDAPNPILTRELVYTGITRAKHWFTLVESGRGMLDEAVTREVMRVSGLGVSE